MADDNLINQEDIERLLSQTKGDAPAPEKSAEKPAAAEAPAPTLEQGEIESLLGGADAGGIPSVGDRSDRPPNGQAAESPAATATPLESGEDDDKLLGQDDIEKLLNQAGTTAAKPAAQPAAPKKETSPGPLAGEGAMPQRDVEFLLNQAEQALESIDATSADELPQGVAAFRLEEFTGAPASTENATLDLIRDVELDLKIELGRTHMYLEDVLKLRKGSVVPLDKLAGDPVDVYVNERLIARGEVLVLNDNFCVRVAELIAGVNPFG